MHIENISNSYIPIKLYFGGITFFQGENGFEDQGR